MSRRMTLIDSVAPFGLFSCCPFGKVAQQTGFPVAGMDTKYIHPVLCRLESVSGLAHVSLSTKSTSTSKLDYIVQ